MFEGTEWKPDRPMIIAHRGASMIAPENTMAAFRAAVESGADAIELDAKLSADGVVFVHHDATLDRTTSGRGAVSSWTAEELHKLDAGSKFADKFAGEGIPTLREVLVGVGGNVLVNVELTNYAHATDALPERVVSLVRELGMGSRVLFSSFNPIAMARARKLAPDIAVGLLLTANEPGWARGLLRSLTPHDALNLQDELVTREAVAAAHVGGRLVYAWTVNDRERMKELWSIGVNGIITDVPDVARRVLLDERRLD